MPPLTTAFFVATVALLSHWPLAATCLNQRRDANDGKPPCFQLAGDSTTASGTLSHLVYPPDTSAARRRLVYSIEPTTDTVVFSG